MSTNENENYTIYRTYLYGGGAILQKPWPKHSKKNFEFKNLDDARENAIRLSKRWKEQVVIIKINYLDRIDEIIETIKP